MAKVRVRCFGRHVARALAEKKVVVWRRKPASILLLFFLKKKREKKKIRESGGAMAPDPMRGSAQDRRMSNVDAQSVSVLSALCALDVFTRPESLLLDRGLATPRNTTTAPPPLSPAKPSADIVFNLVRELAKKAMDTGTEFLLRDTEMEVQTLVTRSNAWKRRLILLTAHTLEVFAEGVPSRPLLVVNLTPDCVVRDSLAAPYALDIVTLRDMVHVSTSSEREKLQFAGAVSRAILQPRSGAAVRVGIPKAHLPPVKQDLPKTPSRLIFDAQRSSVGSSQPSSQ